MANTIRRDDATKQIFPDIKNMVNSSTTFVQGDHAMFDTVSGLVRAPTAEAEAQYYLGVEAVDVSNGYLVGPYTGIADADTLPANAISIDGPLYGNVVEFVLQTGMSASAGCAIYAYFPGSGSLKNQYVSSTGTKQIGVYEGPSVTNAAAGTKVNVRLGARFPNDTLKF